MPPLYRRDHPCHQHLELPRGAELASQPFELFLERGGLRILQNIGKQRHRRAQPPQPNPYLVHALRISRKQRRLVVEHRLEACKPDGLEGIAGACSRREITGGGLYRRGISAFEQLVSAFGLALERELGRKRMGQLARDLEQLGLITSFELELDLA